MKRLIPTLIIAVGLLIGSQGDPAAAALFPGQQFPAGYGPGSVAVADLDGDTVPDLVTSNTSGNDVTVLLGRGDGTFDADVTYGTNHELCFDFLRDNLAREPQEVVHRGYHYALVDEVDFLLIDEARTPLIISGQVERPQEKYQRAAEVAALLERAAEPTFPMAVEMHTRNRWLVHRDVAATVDLLLRGQNARPQIRELDGDGLLTRRLVRITDRNQDGTDEVMCVAGANDLSDVQFSLAGNVLTVSVESTKRVGTRRTNPVRASLVSRVYLQN